MMENMARLKKTGKNYVNLPPNCRYRILPITTPALLPLQKLDVLFGGIEELDKPYEVNRPTPLFHNFVYTIAGSAHYVTPQAEGTMEAGQIGIFPAGIPYQYWAEGRWDICWFSLADTSRWKNIRAMPTTIKPFRRGRKITDLMSICIDEATTAQITALTICSSIAETLGLIIETEFSSQLALQNDELRHRLDDLWSYVATRLGQKWNSAELAKKVFMPRTNFYLAINKDYSCTPREMLIRLRMEHAKQLLMQPNIDMDHVANLLGYDNRFTFSRAFFKYFGLNPGKFRRTPQHTCKLD